eukprot:TRINITY_DN3261_c1_g1_i1.p1 TRINITY_DN3261_c1_g1~~TRINITY_DN3261_c1_g1_i1.p1  ORF type:complete len:109 (-),score=12.52 TRINITY_DN3261_c1_g1_i1:347-673(-)
MLVPHLYVIEQKAYKSMVDLGESLNLSLFLVNLVLQLYKTEAEAEDEDEDRSRNYYRCINNSRNWFNVIGVVLILFDVFKSFFVASRDSSYNRTNRSKQQQQQQCYSR